MRKIKGDEDNIGSSFYLLGLLLCYQRWPSCLLLSSLLRFFALLSSPLLPSVFLSSFLISSHLSFPLVPLFIYSHFLFSRRLLSSAFVSSLSTPFPLISLSSIISSWGKTVVAQKKWGGLSGCCWRSCVSFFSLNLVNAWNNVKVDIRWRVLSWGRLGSRTHCAEKTDGTVWFQATNHCCLGQRWALDTVMAPVQNSVEGGNVVDLAHMLEKRPVKAIRWMNCTHFE